MAFRGGDHCVSDNLDRFQNRLRRGFRLSNLPGDYGLRIKQIEDLTRLQPFPDAANQTSLYIAQKVRPAKRALFTRTLCRVWNPKRGKARIPPTTPLAEVYKWCEIADGAACPVREWGTPLFTGDFAQFSASSFLRGSSPYLAQSHRGTISDCARVHWVKVLKYSDATNRALIRTLTEEELPMARVIEPIDGAWIEADLLYPLVRGRDLGRYAVETERWYQIIPNNHYQNVDNEEDFADKYPLTYSYLKNYESILKNRSSYKRYQTHLPFYVIYCVGNHSFSPYKVAWMEQQDPTTFRAAVVSRQSNSVLPISLLCRITNCISRPSTRLRRLTTYVDFSTVVLSESG